MCGGPRGCRWGPRPAGVPEGSGRATWAPNKKQQIANNERGSADGQERGPMEWQNSRAAPWDSQWAP